MLGEVELPLLLGRAVVLHALLYVLKGLKYSRGTKGFKDSRGTNGLKYSRGTKGLKYGRGIKVNHLTYNTNLDSK